MFCAFLSLPSCAHKSLTSLLRYVCLANIHHISADKSHVSPALHWKYVHIPEAILQVRQECLSMFWSPCAQPCLHVTPPSIISSVWVDMLCGWSGEKACIYKQHTSTAAWSDARGDSCSGGRGVIRQSEKLLFRSRLLLTVFQSVLELDTEPPNACVVASAISV